jgi:hypothetical protein
MGVRRFMIRKRQTGVAKRRNRLLTEFTADFLQGLRLKSKAVTARA